MMRFSVSAAYHLSDLYVTPKTLRHLGPALRYIVWSPQAAL